MLYYEETTTFEPDGKNSHWRSDYWKDFETLLVPKMAERGVYLVGVWETPVGAGFGNEFTFLWRTKDWNTWGSFLEKRHSDTAFRKRWGQQWVYRQSWYTKVITPAPGHEVGILRKQAETTAEPAGTEPAQAKQPYLYYEETVIFEVDGKENHWRSDYWSDFKSILAPNMAKWGIPVVGVWETPVGSGHGNELTFLYRTKDWTSFGQFLEKSRSDMPFRKRWSQQWVYRQKWFTKVMRPATGHPLSILHRETE